MALPTAIASVKDVKKVMAEMVDKSFFVSTAVNLLSLLRSVLNTYITHTLTLA